MEYNRVKIDKVYLKGRFKHLPFLYIYRGVNAIFYSPSIMRRRADEHYRSVNKTES